ncbi:U2 snRNP-associated SURP motif-containing protein [Frankliniella fusca]|uniref:U2 snRNP-associated SURP motif-containing protein n=1 Tax=Frankliniella fusca TaxID=407009 RepID=A0AAE1H0X2_9NEOP|nr:U2 snRNP-associated SURP motif-containing protein [Frankliniella fusca]
MAKHIAEQKLKAFSIGSMGKRPLSKKEQEEQKKKEQEEAAAQAFQEFVATFQDAPSNKSGKVWVKAGTYDAGRRQEDTKEKGKLYKPTSRLEEKSSADQAQEYARLLGERGKPERPGKKKEREKRKSNLELFKEELKTIQEEREERHKYKGMMKSSSSSLSGIYESEESSNKLGSFDNGDPTTTNLYLGNLNPKITEQQLMQVFGKYGPLASIKIMWPRSDEEKARGRNCGFVAFMNRKDGERALKHINGKDVMQYEMKLGWGKGVPIPPHPIYIPPAMLQLTLPPPQSGLPFNAQPCRRDRDRVPKLKPSDPYPTDPDQKAYLDDILYNAVVKVVIPTERNVLMLIHRMIEFVIREGPMFEAMIMNREINNPMFRFLFENQNPMHIYYRWKLFSLLQGDLQAKWRTEEFRMFKGGSVWKPPPMNPYTQGMPEELVEYDEVDARKGSLSNSQRERLEDLLRNISPERTKVAEAMIFCIEHSEAAEEICDCIQEALSNSTTLMTKKIARFYLISDILHNCGVSVNNASYYRKAFESRLMPIMFELHAAYTKQESRLKAEGFRMRVLTVLNAWKEWAVYPRSYLIALQNTFLGLSVEIPRNSDPESDDNGPDSDIDGAPLSRLDDDIDGVPLLKGALKGIGEYSDDIDGVPMDDDIDGVPLDEERRPSRKGGMPAGFVPSRWETVDPEQVEAQAMTTSKWDLLEGQDDDDDSVSNGDNSMDSNPMLSSSRDEEKRARLRDIEVKAMQYQDELESGQRALKSGWNISQQVEHYRRKLLRKAEREAQAAREEKLDKKDKRKDKKDRSDRSRRSMSPDDDLHYRDSSVSSRSRSKRSRSWSGSPGPSKRSHRSRSRSPQSSRSRRRSRSPYTSGSKRRGGSPLSPSPSRQKRRGSPSPQRSKHRGQSPQSPRNSRRRNSVSPSPPPRSKHHALSPSTPPRKHKHKHKY